MERLAQIKKLSEKDKVWDIVVVGGGATGLGVAVDAATRGMSVALLEKTDFAKCTSSRSTKLVHGGVRYLQKGDVMLVLEALRERGRMKANAPHLVKDQAFVISNYRYWDNFLYFCGLTFYDMLSFGFGYGRSKYISAKKVMKYIPTSVEKGLKGGVVYHDGQFDDSRMAVNLAQTCVENGGTVVNQTTVTGIVHDAAGRAAGVKFVDNLTGEEHTLKARSVVNAAGCFVDDIMHMDSPTHRRMVTPSQGVHIVLDMKFLQSDYAIMVPKTSDGRVLFAVPWHDKVVVGTTDIVRPKAEEDPRPLKEEIDFILGTAGLYMNPAPTYKDILSVFAGQRPLAAPKKEGKNTKEISRSHKVITSDNGLVTITGGKWTSYRLMAEDTVDKAIEVAGLPRRKCVTKKFHIHGYRKNPNLAVIVIVPDLLQDLFAAQCNALVADQKNQQIKLLRGQRRLLPGHLYAVAGRVDGQIAEGIAPGGLGGLGHRAGQHGLDTGDQLPRGERLDDIVIGTALQPGQLVVFLTAGGQHDHGGHDLAGAHLPQAGHAVHKRHHNVQNYQINAALAQHAQRGGAVAGLLTGKARILQMLADEVPDARLIIHDQNFSHRNTLLIRLYYHNTMQEWKNCEKK